MKIFKSKKAEVKSSKAITTLSRAELKNVIGGETSTFAIKEQGVK